MNAVIQRLLSLPKALVGAMALALLCVIGLLDYVTGRDLAFSVFYLAPICWCAWVCGRRAGFLMALAGATIWLKADSMSDFVYPHEWFAYWNGLILCVVFLIVVYLLMEIQTAHHYLVKTVQERTAALQELKLEIKERKRLEIATLKAERLAVVGKMAAQVAHEIRNPLGSITLNLDLITRELGKLAGGNEHSPDEGRTLIKDIREEVCRIGRVIEDYLQFARLPKLRREPMALNALLDQKLAFLNSELERANVTLRAHFDPGACTINADANQLWQAMLNLIRNSCEAMPRGGELTISTLRDGGRVLLRVVDNGKGMSEEQRQQMFVPFYTTKSEGVGLGMALVHQIVTEHGGRIECESSRGKGSAFTISLPVAEQS
jgi:signal transduction histidine kinase